MQTMDAPTSQGTEQAPRFREWALLELMGHRREAGLVTEASFPAGWIRLDIPQSIDPAEGWAATRFYNPAAGYGVTPCTEALAREYATAHPPVPVSVWDLPAELRERLRPQPAVLNGGGEEEEEELAEDDAEPF